MPVAACGFRVKKRIFSLGFELKNSALGAYKYMYRVSLSRIVLKLNQYAHFLLLSIFANF